ncbi:hypothetical protein PO124_12765 [Bacillus licheniformis]|nr:hypothetical protein [Bacillus licheniformis]
MLLLALLSRTGRFPQRLQAKDRTAVRKGYGTRALNMCRIAMYTTRTAVKAGQSVRPENHRLLYELAYGKGNQDRYLVSDIPWKYLSHINYAFAHIGEDHRISVGEEADENNPSIGMTWPEHPDVKWIKPCRIRGILTLSINIKIDTRM